jgi:hypothetical protein
MSRSGGGGSFKNTETSTHFLLRRMNLLLERRVRHGGHSSIDHEPGGHDDLANVAAGVSVDLLAPEEQEIEIEYDPLGLENRITPELDEADGFVPGW